MIVNIRCARASPSFVSLDTLRKQKCSSSMLKVCSTNAVSRLRLSWCQQKLLSCRRCAASPVCLLCLKPAQSVFSSTSYTQSTVATSTAVPSSTLDSLTQLQQQIGQLSLERTVQIDVVLGALPHTSCTKHTGHRLRQHHLWCL